MLLAVVCAPAWADVPASSEWSRLLSEGRARMDGQDFSKAAPVLEQSLRAAEARHGTDSLQAAESLNWLGVSLCRIGRASEGEAMLERSLVIVERSAGPGSELPLVVPFNLAVVRMNRGDLSGAEKLLQAVLAEIERRGARSHSINAVVIGMQGRLNLLSGRLAEGERLTARALKLNEAILGPFHPQTAESLFDMAVLYRITGRFGQARQYASRSLEAREMVFGANHPLVAKSLEQVALAHVQQAEWSAAEKAARRALAIVEATLGPDSIETAGPLNTLGEARRQSGRLAEAIPLYGKALDVMERKYGPGDLRTAMLLNNLGGAHAEAGRLAEAEPYLRRSLAVHERFHGSSLVTAQVLCNLAQTVGALGRLDEADALLHRALAIMDRSAGHAHPLSAAILNSLAFVAAQRDRPEDALAYVRRANAALRASVDRDWGPDASVSGVAQYRSRREMLSLNIEIMHRAAASSDAREAIGAESFEVAQMAKASDTSAAVARSMTRFASRDEEAARLVRSRQEALARRRALESVLVGGPESAALPAGARTLHLGLDLDAVDRRLREDDAALRKRFPEFAALASGTPSSVEEVRSLLRPGEALVSYLVTPRTSFVWVLRRERVVHARLDLGKEEVDRAVARLRRGLDLSTGAVPRYPLEEAHSLFVRLLGPVMPDLAGAHTLIVVADGALQSLPFGVLVTEPPRREAGSEAYREAAWMGERFALSTLPSENTLAALRRTAPRSGAPLPFAGFGDPVFGGAAGERPRRAGDYFSARGIADTRELARLQRLPESADEIRAMADVLGAGPDAVFLRERASETQVKKTDLSRYRVVAFATHGLVSGDFKGLVEPSLVLTPPATATESDDGLLTASEVSQLRLHADLVVLSACNTAASDGTPGAEGLSGLAKAFFVAGTRSLLVSHWPVESRSATRLTTEMIRHMAREPESTSAEALRRSSGALRMDPARAEHAHPAFWAPFVLVGAP